MKSHRRVSIASRGARFALVALAVLGMVGVEGRSTASDSTFDPLTMPRPELRVPLILPLDERAPAAKIVTTMPAALQRLEDPSSVRVIVSLHQPMVDASVETRSARAKADRLAAIANIEHDFVEGAGRLGFRPEHGLRNFAIVSGEISPERLVHLAGLRQVKAIEPDRVMRADTAEGLALVNSDELASDFGLDGEGITVVVLDSGINAGHPELAGKVDVQRSFNGPAGQDGFNHGTKVAGIVAGDSGAAPAARLWDVRVIDNSGNTTIAILLQALDDLADEMDQFEIMVGAFSDHTLPFSTACDALNPAAAQLVDSFRDAGKLLVGSSGNNADGQNIGIPACLNGILAAGAVYDANVGSISFGGCTDATTTADKIACYSNGGPLVDFYAPGHCTRAPQAGGGFDSCFGGTSASAGYVAGVAAQIWSGVTEATGQDLVDALKSTGPNLNDPRSGTNRRRIDGEAAFDALGGDPPTPQPTATRTSTPGGGPQPTPTRTPTRTPTLPPGGLPGAPSNLTAVPVSHTAILLEWNDNSTNETSFRLEARTGGGSFTEVGTAPANVRFMPVEGLMPSTLYELRVRARNASGNSGYTNVAAASTAANTPACVPDADTACLLGDQFRIEGAMKNFANPPVTFPLQVMDFPGGRAESDQASFWDSFNTGNFEIAIKMQDACSLAPGHPLRFYWAFFGGLTDQRTDMTIMDTVTQATKTFHNPANTFPTTIADTMAFPCVNPGGQTACTANATTACLLNDRFKVTGSMQNAQQQVFTTNVMNFPNALSVKPRNRAETDQSAFFQSFEAGNFEVGVKMLDACSLAPGHPLRFYWIFYGGLTNAATEVRATHSTTGNVDIWRNPSGSVPTSEGRTMAFPCP